jgi:molybdopterin-guanine dinucleotide biosynthesis protein A
LALVHWGGCILALKMEATNMPFLQPSLIIHLARKRLDFDVVIPRTQQGLEPFHAFYSKRCIEPIKKNLERGELKITKFLTEVQVGYCDEEEIRKIDPSLASFTNANTKKDLMEIQRMLKRFDNVKRSATPTR